jgi:hypothetical protein
VIILMRGSIRNLYQVRTKTSNYSKAVKFSENSVQRRRKR